MDRKREHYLISILVPIYGVERFIGTCAESLFSQSYENLEYIFVDDCTPDGSIDILQGTLKRYPMRQSQVKIIRHQSNRGLGASRKTALTASNGTFVLNVDSDDYLTEGAVDALMAVQEKTDADIVSGSYIQLLPNGERQEMTVRHLDKELMLKLLLMQNTIPQNIWARLIRKSVYTTNGIDSVEGIDMAEDYALTPRLIHAAHSIAFCDKAVYVYRLGSATSTFGAFMKPRHIISFLSANETVRQYIQACKDRDRYQYALETGLLNTFQKAFAAGFSKEQILEVMPHTPQLILFRICNLLFAHKLSERLLRLTYLAVKWCYKRILRIRD